MEHKVPASVKAEHEELHEELEKATKVKGGVGQAAKKVAKVLHPHFAKEEEYALPPLTILRRLAEGKFDSEMMHMISMSDKLRADLPNMVREHKEIVSALNGLAAAAKKAKRPEQLRFSEKLILHAQNEEEILYPASILAGDYLKLKYRKSG
jgi:hemerythrin